jgi:hypothetical protein
VVWDDDWEGSLMKETPSLREFRAPKDAPTKTKWIEMPNGTGHWASNWELQQEAKRG